MFNNNLPLKLNEELRRNLIDNFNFLYKRHSKLLKLINDHKYNDDVAHTTKQITEGARSQYDVNNDLQSQVDMLAVAPRNESENEIVQARVDIFGNQYPSLKRHLIAWEERTKIMKDEVMEAVNEAKKTILDLEYRFDIEEQEFLYITDLSPQTNAVMQSFWIDERTGIIYMTQAHSSYTITRLRPNGAFIDKMWVGDGGHGTHNGYRYVGNKLWIYSFINDYDGRSRLVRFSYQPNRTVSYGTYDMEEVFTGHPENPYITAIINQHTQEILFRIQYPESEWNKRNSMNYIEIRDLEDVDNRIDNVKHRFDIPLHLTGANRPMQGVEFDEEFVYWYTGSSNTQVDNQINKFTRDGKEVSETIVDYGGVDGVYPGDFQEPEGLQIYYNADGKKALILGVVVGGAGNRSHKLYTVAQRGVLDELKSRGTPVPLTDTGGRTKPLPLDPLKMRNLQDIREPGYYYLYTNHTKDLDDFPLPKNQRDAGWFFQVEPSHSSGTTLQRLVRNSYGRNLLTFERFVSGNSISPWNLVYKSAGYWERMPSDTTQISDLNIVGMKYYLTAAETNQLVDFPKERAGYAGWVLHVEQGKNIGEFMHRLVRNNTVAPTEILYRNYRSSDTTEWFIFRAEAID